MGKRAEKKRRVTRRRMREEALSEEARAHLREHASYEGVPYHKRSPGDFGLEPPAAPRPDKTLCDEAGVTARATAQGLLTRAIEGGLASEHEGAPGFPKQLWVVDDGGRPFEAMYGGSRAGAYHGYPIRQDDPFFREVIAAWDKRNG